MDKTVTVSKRINFYNCGRDRELNLRSYLGWSGEMGNLHLEQGGLTWERMQQEGQAFVLAKVAFQRMAPVQYGDLCQFHTWVGGVQGAQFLRYFSLEGEGGRVLMQSASTWALIDPAERKILRPKTFRYEMPVNDRSVQPQIRRIRLGELPVVGQHIVRAAQIDPNGHMGNQYYADLLTDFAPAGLGLRSIEEAQLVFAHEAREGEALTICTALTGPRSYELSAKLPDGRTCFEAQVTVSPQIGGENEERLKSFFEKMQNEG